MPSLRPFLFATVAIAAIAGCGAGMGSTATPGNSRVPCAENCGSDATCMAQCDPTIGHTDPVQAAQPWNVR